MSDVLEAMVSEWLRQSDIVWNAWQAETGNTYDRQSTRMAVQGDATRHSQRLLDELPELTAEEGVVLIDLLWTVGVHVNNPHDYDEIAAMVAVWRKFTVTRRATAS